MSRIIQVVYGFGGYDPNKPNNNIIEIIWGNDEEQIDEWVEPQEPESDKE